jgi:hypothetical protein
LSALPGIHVLLARCAKDVDGRDISAFTRVFDALCPAMTLRESRMKPIGLKNTAPGRLSRRAQ